jgi:hypothetical protein
VAAAGKEEVEMAVEAAAVAREAGWVVARVAVAMAVAEMAATVAVSNAPPARSHRSALPGWCNIC